MTQPNEIPEWLKEKINHVLDYYGSATSHIPLDTKYDAYYVKGKFDALQWVLSLKPDSDS